MSRWTKTRVAAVGGALALVAAVTAGVSPAQAADHLDAPGLTSPDGLGQLDINDVYAFEGRPGYTTLAMTVSPLATAKTDFASGFTSTYSFRVDLNGDAVEDTTYHVRALFPFFFNEQVVIVQRDKGRTATSPKPSGTLRGVGITNNAFNASGTKAFVGLRSDPFFFDLSGFQGTVEGNGEDALGDDPTDFFEDANTLGIVLELPDSELNGGGPIGVWGTTSRSTSGNAFFGEWKQVDRMGRPAINTVVNSSGPIVNAPSGNKVAFNRGIPANDVANFTPAVVNALTAFSSLDSEGSYSQAQSEALAAVLLPDILTYDKASQLPAPLNGRALADDVIDTELRIVTGGDPLGLFDDRDADGGVNSDGVGPHDDYLPVFPYLGQPHS